MLNIQPDWTAYKTAAEAEDDFLGFKWKGPGWYTQLDGQTLLVVPNIAFSWPPTTPELNVWKQRWPEHQIFVFMSYSAPPFDSFNAVANAPTRQDDSR